MKRVIPWLLVCAACGGDPPPPPTTPKPEAKNLEVPPPDEDPDAAAPEPTAQEKRDKQCTGFDLDLAQTLLQAACEVPLDPAAKPMDTKGKLEVRVAASTPTVAPSAKVDLTVTYVNKTAAPLTLDFVIDPTARFSVEAFDPKTNKRVDMPWGNPPAPPKGVKRPEPAKASLARVTLVANGTAKMTVPWSAVKTRWAPEKYAGTPPEMGFPRVAAGALPKGKYRLRVVTPLHNVAEGADKEVSAPKLDVAVQ